MTAFQPKNYQSQVLASVAALHSATSVEQLLGRVLRQPQARQRGDAATRR